MEHERTTPKRLWDTCREVPIIEDQQTPWKLIKLLKSLSVFLVAVIVFGLALCSRTSFLLLITFSNEGTKIIPAEQKPVALLCVGCCLAAPSVLLLQKGIWKSCYKSGKMPAKKTLALVLFFELVVSLGAAVLTVVAMPHLDIVTNVTMLNGVAVLSSLLQVISQCSAKERNRLLLPSVAAFLFLLLGYILFLCLYLMKDPADSRTAVWAGLAVAASFLVSFNWWENYFRLMGENSRSDFLRNLCRDMTKSQNMLHIFSSLLRIVVTACVVGAAVPLSQMDWEVLTSIPSGQTRVVVITVGVQLVSSALCHWFALAACKMHALRRCFITPLYLASLGVVVLYVVPVIVYYQDYRTSLNGTAVDFTGYCRDAVDGRNRSLNGSVFPHLVMDVTHTLCFLDMSKMDDIGILTGSAVSWWLGLVLATIHLWHISLYRIERTEKLFIRRMYEGAFLEPSLLLNFRYDIQISQKLKPPLKPVKVFLCATMWHETYSEMLKIIISMFRLDMYRPRKEGETADVTFEGHVYFDDAFKDVPGSRGRHVNEYAETVVEIIQRVYGIFLNLDKGLFTKQQQIPVQTLVRTPYGGRLQVTMPHGSELVIHFKDKKLIRHKKRWSQVMYLYYILGFKVATKYYKRSANGENVNQLKQEFLKEKANTYILALDGDTDFHPAAVMLLVDRLKLYPLVGAACGRIHPTGSGPLVWYQKFEYAMGHWLNKTAEHVFGCVLCSPGCFSLFRASALMDDNVMKKYTIKAKRALHYIQYNQGEDRWLCTLMLKQGWRVEYNAASDAYTNAPEEFKEFYNQRRRWGPSTFANNVDLLGSASLLSKRNMSISKLYLLYQLFSVGSSIVGPSTIILMLAGSLTMLFGIDTSLALVLTTIPPAIYVAISFKTKPDTQITVAAVMSVLYAVFMLMTVIAVIGDMVASENIMTPGSLFIITIACFYLITAFLHPQEVGLLVHGLLYLLCIPSAHLLMAIYSIMNLDNVSWGTRETVPPPGAAGTDAKVVVAPQTQAQKVTNRLSSWARFCNKLCRRGYEDEVKYLTVATAETEPVPPNLNPTVEAAESENLPQNTLVEDAMTAGQQETPGNGRSVEGEEEPAFTCPNQCWVTQLQSLSDHMHLHEETLNQEEAQFFSELIEKYLQPFANDKKKQKEMADQLQDLKKHLVFAYLFCNALWLLMTLTLQFLDIFIPLPEIDVSLQLTGDYISIDPLGFMFILGFALLVIVQFLAMLYQRIYTLVHFVAFMETESHKLREKQVADNEADDEGDFKFHNFLNRQQEEGTLV